MTSFTSDAENPEYKNIQNRPRAMSRHRMPAVTGLRFFVMEYIKISVF